MRTTPITKVPGGAAVGADQYNRLAEAVRRLERRVGNEVSDNTQQPFARAAISFPFLATVQTAGPNGEAQYTDSRYWLRRAVPSSYANTSAMTGAADYSSGSVGTDVIEVVNDPWYANNQATILPYWFTATNLAELDPTWTALGRSASPIPSRGSHLLFAQQIVEVTEFRDGVSSSTVWYTFNVQPLRLFVLTGQAATAGCYTMQQVKIANPGVDPTAGGQFTSTQVGTGIGATVYGINLREQNKSGADASQWDLDTTGTYQPQGAIIGVFCGVALDGKAKFYIDVRQNEDCSG